MQCRAARHFLSHRLEGTGSPHESLSITVTSIGKEITDEISTVSVVSTRRQCR